MVNVSYEAFVPGRFQGRRLSQATIDQLAERVWQEGPASFFGTEGCEIDERKLALFISKALYPGKNHGAGAVKQPTIDRVLYALGEM